METRNLPIGIFDSGLGGLTVLKELKRFLPQEDFLYLGDTARLPYGSKSAETIKKYVEQTFHFFATHRVKAIVVACNSASSVILGQHSTSTTPVYNVIEPGAKQALKATQSGRIGILATRATVNGESYVKTILQMNPKIECFQQAAPLLVPLVEEGWLEDPLTNLVLYRYLNPLLTQNIDTLILGCTHYPLLASAIQKICGSKIKLVSSGMAVAHALKEDLNRLSLLRASEQPSRTKILTTDSGEHFKAVAAQILAPFTFDEFEKTDL